MRQQNTEERDSEESLLYINNGSSSKNSQNKPLYNSAN